VAGAGAVSPTAVAGAGWVLVGVDSEGVAGAGAVSPTAVAGAGWMLVGVGSDGVAGAGAVDVAPCSSAPDTVSCAFATRFPLSATTRPAVHAAAAIRPRLGCGAATWGLAFMCGGFLSSCGRSPGKGDWSRYRRLPG
jgi:hypothetical protein